MVTKSSGVALMALVLAMLILPPTAGAGALSAKGNQIWHLNSPGTVRLMPVRLMCFTVPAPVSGRGAASCGTRTVPAF
jgi:hypothetical protein